VRYQGKVSRIYFRADATFAMPAAYEYLEADGSITRSGCPPTKSSRTGSAISSSVRLGDLRTRCGGSTPISPISRKLDQAASGDRKGRVELYPRVGFIVTNMSCPAERVVAFYNKRGTCEQWIKEGKEALKRTRLSCRTFAANAVRL
jgi:DDE family transposase